MLPFDTLIPVFIGDSNWLVTFTAIMLPSSTIASYVSWLSYTADGLTILKEALLSATFSSSNGCILLPYAFVSNANATVSLSLSKAGLYPN